jgi:Transposase IS200 like
MQNQITVEKEPAGMRFRRLDVQLDEIRSGPRWLENPQIAACVQDALVRGERLLGQYHLHAYVLMPNHVHILITPKISLCRIMRGLKGVSARDANRVLGGVEKCFGKTSPMIIG